ncbi:hypothetical protein ACQV5M_19255, partial [Leptospira sp. SA-E8]|uniref:hypothetical protein n=1 Tax=Leptospira sp. SA-E8 TaxID=3422259 RepID=UPI003EB7BF98
TQDGPTLVAVRNRSGGGSRLYMFYRGVGEDAWLYYSRFDRRDPFITSAWIDENSVGGSGKSHQAFYEVGVCAFERDI